ncbi:hypothetical protein AB6N23_01785 [Cellulomonas sp. 179-A 9B4 NHS]|uniref:hypothetical protein n=1 Tax=Cellulomonas sp. 179-A 9B4 NHS TaxID=3142379 RepID=UPI00399F2EDA
MATEDDAQNPFTRRGFIAAALVIALIVVLGVVIAIVNATRADDTAATPTTAPTTTSAAATTSATQAAGGASVCGLAGEELSGTITTAPEAVWEYQGTIGYPTSELYGPGETADGARYCFQRSPAGALFMAANAIAQGSDPATSSTWAQRALAEGPYREQLLTDVGAGSSDGTRLRVAGFRVLDYDGDSARIDLGVVGSASGQNVTLSGVYELVWQVGDWKISADVPAPLDMATIPDLAGYITWGE